jgi:hypothetical protein
MCCDNSYINCRYGQATATDQPRRPQPLHPPEMCQIGRRRAGKFENASSGASAAPPDQPDHGTAPACSCCRCNPRTPARQGGSKSPTLSDRCPRESGDPGRNPSSALRAASIRPLLTMTPRRALRISPPTAGSNAAHHTSPRRLSALIGDIACQVLHPLLLLALMLLVRDRRAVNLREGRLMSRAGAQDR